MTVFSVPVNTIYVSFIIYKLLLFEIIPLRLIYFLIVSDNHEVFLWIINSLVLNFNKTMNLYGMSWDDVLINVVINIYVKLMYNQKT